MAIEGSLDLFGLPEILQMISQQGKTGILTIQGQQDIVAVSFLSGKIVAADSLAHTIEEGLGQVLVGEGLLGAADFARANAENHATGGRLLDFLVDRGILARQDLMAALRLQTMRQLGTLLHWQQGDFKFYSGDEVSYEDGFEPISVEDLLLRSLAEFSAPAAPAVQPQPGGAGSAAPGMAAAGAAAGMAAAPAAPALPWSQPVAAPPAPASRPVAATAAGSLDAVTSAQAGPLAGGPPFPAPAAPQPAAAGGGTDPRGRRPAGRQRPDSGELWLPEVPELPEVSLLPHGAGGAGAAPPFAVAVPPAAAGASRAAAPAAGAGAAAPPRAPAVNPVPPAGAAGPAGSPGLPGSPGSSGSLGSPGSSGSLGSPGSLGSSRQPAAPLPWPAAVMIPPASAAAAAARPRVEPVRQRPDGARGPAGAGAAAPGAMPAVAAAAATIAVPPSPGAPAYVDTPPLPAKFRQMRIERTGMVPGSERLVVGLLALALVGLVVGVVRRLPQAVPLPFPWQQAERGTLVRNQRESLYNKIDRAAKTAFLRDGRFPDRLSQLAESGLLSPADLVDPDGEPLRYTAREDSYLLQAVAAGQPVADSEVSESIAGNFLLDPNLLQNHDPTGPPVVLLD